MYQALGITALTAPQAAVVFGALLGLAFGLLAERTGFCLRRSVVAGPDRRQAAGVWLAAFAAALVGTQAAVAAGWIGFGDHRFHAGDLPVMAILVGGLMFGVGMVLARGCISRLVVLSGTGNLRAALVVLVFALAALATMRGVLVPLRLWLGEATVPLGAAASLGGWPGGALLWTVLGVAALLAVALRSGAGQGALVAAVALGLLVPLGWVGTGLLLQDDFDPVAMQSLAFTSSSAEALFWVGAATSIPLGFGVGLVGGTVLGALASAVLARRFRWQSFERPGQTGRSLSGAALMGVGGTLAGGCTVGAGLSGTATLSVAAFLALGAMIAGGVATDRALSRASRGSVGRARARAPRPAE
ncbi:YeeE/YedE family protein [Rhodosalinus sp.]|uniref:YeeE/YedE family protein n=1 Tax=Rhodosalinus sp. TaxID=2047741 RepID=UPI003566C432